MSRVRCRPSLCDDWLSAGCLLAVLEGGRASLFFQQRENPVSTLLADGMPVVGWFLVRTISSVSSDYCNAGVYLHFLGTRFYP